MTDLKTLKDIKLIWTGDEDGYEWFEDSHGKMISCGDTDKLVSIEDLKTEAIKHIKMLRSFHRENSANPVRNQTNTVEWIIYFFNITEEDLK